MAGLPFRALLAAMLVLAGGVPAYAAAVRPGPTLEAAARADARLGEIYAARGFTPLWQGNADADTRRTVALALLAREQRFAPAGVPAEKLARAVSGRPDPEAELALSRAFLGYLERRGGGRPVRATAATRVLDGLAAAHSTSDLDLALEELKIVDALGGWTPVRMRAPASVVIPPLTPVTPELEQVPPANERPRSQPDVPGLRRRLIQSLDLAAQYAGGEKLDGPVAQAVRRFQARHGLVPDGVVGFKTAALLNESVTGQIARVELNVARNLAANIVSGRAGFRRYVEVNVPSFELRLMEDGRVTYRSRVIVGDEDKPTPVFDDWMRYIDLNPSWYVPRSIEQEILDKEAKEPGYMSKAGFVWQSAGAGAPARLIQRPGPENALGRLKFVFPNRNSVYIHDTPNRGLFNRSDRTLSHGCIRLEQPLGLAAALLRAQGWDQGRLDAALQEPKTHRVHLDSPVPVFLDYRTATLDAEGRLLLWPDVYGYDEEGVTRFPMKGLPPEQELAPPQPEATPAAPETVAVRQATPPTPAPVAGL